MKLVGDPEAIAVLKDLHQNNPGFLKALVDDARSTTDHATTFRDDSGARYRMTLDVTTGELKVEPAPARISKLPPKGTD